MDLESLVSAVYRQTLVACAIVAAIDVVTVPLTIVLGSAVGEPVGAILGDPVVAGVFAVVGVLSGLVAVITVRPLRRLPVAARSRWVQLCPPLCEAIDNGVSGASDLASASAGLVMTFLIAGSPLLLATFVGMLGGPMWLAALLTVESLVLWGVLFPRRNRLRAFVE